MEFMLGVFGGPSPSARRREEIPLHMVISLNLLESMENAKRVTVPIVEPNVCEVANYASM